MSTIPRKDGSLIHVNPLVVVVMELLLTRRRCFCLDLLLSFLAWYYELGPKIRQLQWEAEDRRSVTIGFEGSLHDALQQRSSPNVKRAPVSVDCPIWFRGGCDRNREWVLMGSCTCVCTKSRVSGSTADGTWWFVVIARERSLII